VFVVVSVHLIFQNRNRIDHPVYFFIMPSKQPATTKTPAKKAASAPGPKTPEAKNPLIEKRPKIFGIGQAIQPKRDLSRFVKYPRYIAIQRQRRILMSRFKVPPTLNQFSRTLDKSTASLLFKVLGKYRPESRVQRRQRLRKTAEAKTKGETVAAVPKAHIRFGLNTVVTLIERKEAKLVIIAHDVDPIELVVFLPTLCRKMGVPYVIVKSKSRLGAVVHKKTATAIALTSVEKEDLKDFQNLTDIANQSFNNNTEVRRAWGGNKLGSKAQAALKKKEKAVAKEQAAKVSS